MDVGKRVRELREQKGISTNKLANLSGISQSYLRDIELGDKNPTVEVISYICGALNITLQDFFTEQNVEKISPFLLSALRELTEQEQDRLAEFISAVSKRK